MMLKMDVEMKEVFLCNICLEQDNDPVVTLCGHLFCWPCIFQWLHAHSIFKVSSLQGRGS